MTSMRRPNHPVPKPRRVFQRRRRVPAGVVFRQLSAVVLMLAGSCGIIIGLQRLPEQVDVVLLVSEAVADLIRGVQQLLEAFLGEGTWLHRSSRTSWWRTRQGIS